MNIFPDLKNKKWAEINLNEESLKLNIDFTNPEICDNWVISLAKARKVDYGYGGFLENRSNLWKNQYNAKTGAFIHLGIDFNVPAGTKVALIKKAKVEHIFIDESMDGGWGGRVMWKILDSPYYIIYGHLSHNINLKVGDVCEAGTLFAETGTSAENGNWYPHLHIQLMDEEFVKSFPDLNKIDGYLPKGDRLLRHVINPMHLVSF